MAIERKGKKMNKALMWAIVMELVTTTEGRTESV